MADIRINSLPTTAVASSSDDFLALDGTTNGTRKLNAYSPTFGGNLTVNGTGTSTIGGSLTVSGTSALNGTVNTNGARAVNVTPTMTPLSGNLYGLYVQPTINSGASAGGTVSGLTVAATNSGTSNVTNIAGIEFIGGNGAASGSMQDLKAFRSSPINLSTGQIVNLYQFYATNAYNPSGTINTQYGLYVDALTSATTNYAIYTAGTAPSVLGGNLTVSGTGNGITIAPTAGAANLVINGAAAGSTINFAESGTNKYTLEYVSASNFWSIGRSGVAYDLVLKSGNLLIGTTIDGGQKLQVAGVGIFSSTESAVTLYATASGGIQYQLISGGNLGHALGAFKIVDSSTGYVVLNHDKPTSGGTRLSFDGAGNATFAGTVTSNTANASFTAKGNGGLSGYFVSDGNLQDAWGSTAFHLIIKRGKNTATQNRWNLATVDAEITPDSGAGCNLSFQYAINNGAWTEALKLDRSSNATFAGKITAAGAIVTTGSVANMLEVTSSSTNATNFNLINSSTGAATWSIGSAGSASGTGDAAGTLYFYQGSGTKFSLEKTTGNASFAGTIATQGGTASTPANAFATGAAGTIRWDASYIYVCTAANTWKRVAIAAW